MRSEYLEAGYNPTRFVETWAEMSSVVSF